MGMWTAWDLHARILVFLIQHFVKIQQVVKMVRMRNVSMNLNVVYGVVYEISCSDY